MYRNEARRENAESGSEVGIQEEHRGDTVKSQSCSLQIRKFAAIYRSRKLRCLIPRTVLAILVAGITLPHVYGQSISVVSAASYQPTVAPGSLASIFGSNLAPQTITGAPGANGSYPKQLDGVTVTVGGAAADLVVVSPTQINFVVPFSNQYGTLSLVVALGAQTVAASSVTVSPTAPAIFTTNASGTGFGAILNGIDFTQPPFTLTTQTSAGGSTNTIVAVYGTGFRFAGGAAVSNQSGDVSAHITAIASNPMGKTWTLPVLYAGPAPGYEGLDQINVQLTPDLDASSDLTLMLFADAIGSNPVFLWLRHTPPPAITNAAPTSASPGATVTITATGLLSPVAVSASQRESVLIILKDGTKVAAPILITSQDSIDISIPAYSPKDDGNFYYGDAQICLLVDSQQDCSPIAFSITAPASSTQPIGAALVAFIQAAATQSESALPAGTDPSIGAAIASAAASEISNLQEMIAAATAGTPQTIQIADLSGKIVPVVMDLATIQKIEALLTANSSSSTNSAARMALRVMQAKQNGSLDFPSSTSWCNPTESDLINSASTYSGLNVASEVIDLAGMIPFILAAAEGCADALAGGPPGCIAGAAVATAGLLAESAFILEVDGIVNDVVKWAIESRPVFLDGLTVVPADVTLNYPQSTTAQFSVLAQVSPARAAGSDLLSFITAEVAEKILNPLLDACVPCYALKAFDSDAYEGLVENIEGYVVTAVTSRLPGNYGLLDIGACTATTVDLGGRSLSYYKSPSNAPFEVSLPTDDGAAPSLTLMASPTQPSESVTFSATNNLLWATGTVTAPTATLGVYVSERPPTLTTDHASYLSTDTITVTGDYFAPGTAVTLTLQGNGQAVILSSVVATATGDFQQTTFFPTGTSTGSYKVFATSSIGMQSASVAISIQGSLAASFTMSANGQTANSGGVLNLGVTQGATVKVTLDGSASASSGTIATWSWQNNGSSLPCNGSTCTYAFPTTTPSNSIQLVITNTAGQPASAIGQLNISVQSAAPGTLTLTPEMPVCDQTPPAGPAVRLDWTIAANASNYDIYRNSSVIAANVSGTTFYNNAGLSAGQTYTYLIRAKNSVGTTNSNPVTVSIPANICQPASSLPSIQSLAIAPASVTAGSSAAVTITLSGPAPSGGAIVSLSSNNAAFPVPPSFTVPPNQNTASFSAQSSGSITLTTTTTVTATYNNSTLNASVTITVTPGGLPTLTGVSISPTTVTGGSSATLSFTLSGPAPSGGAVIGLSANSSAFPVPRSFTVPPGQSTASFSAQSSTATPSTTVVTVTATYNSSSQNATVTVTPSSSGLALTSVSINPSSLPTGGFATVSVTVNGLAPANGAVVTLQTSNSTAFSVPSTIIVPPGQSTNGIPVQAGVVNASTTVTVTATYGGSTQIANVTVTPSVSGQLVVAPSVPWTPQFTVGGQPATLGLQISSQNAGTLTGIVAATTANGQQWLTVDGHASDNWVAPAGISMTANPSGLSPGTYPGSVIVSAPAAANSPVTIQVIMTIVAPLQITTTTPPTGTWGQPYSYQLQATGGSSYSWSLQSGSSLPVGLSLSSSGLISGTLPAASSTNTYSFTVVVTDSTNRTAFANLSIKILAAFVITDTSPSSFQFILGTTYVPPSNGNNSMTFQASGGTAPYSWSATGLPPGLGIDSPSGTIVGTPTQPGTFSSTITATDSQGRTGSGMFSLVVVTSPLYIIGTNGQRPPTLPSGTVGVAYSQSLGAVGGSQVGYQWSTTGALPGGVTAQANVNAPCTPNCGFIISGTPTQTGTFNFTVQVKDSLGNIWQQPLVLVINSGTPPQITTTTLTLGTIGQAYTFTFAATGGAGGYMWSFNGPSPDAGLQLSSSGLLQGTSTVPNDCPTGPAVWIGNQPPFGSYSSSYFQVQVTDSAGQSANKQLCLPSFYPTPVVTSITPPSVTVDGQSKTITVNGSGFRNGAYFVGNALGEFPATFVSSSALTFTLTPSATAAYGLAGGGLSEGAHQFGVLQPYSSLSNQNQSLTIYDPVPAISSVQAVLNNSNQPCTANLNCQLVVNGSGLVFATTYTIVETGTSLVRAVYPSTPIPWNTVTTSAFSLAAGTYTLQVTNYNQPGGGSVAVTAQFTVTQ